MTLYPVTLSLGLLSHRSLMDAVPGSPTAAAGEDVSGTRMAVSHRAPPPPRAINKTSANSKPTILLAFLLFASLSTTILPTSTAGARYHGTRVQKAKRT